MASKITLAVALVCLGYASTDPIRLQNLKGTKEVRSPIGQCPRVDGEFPMFLKDAHNCQVYYQCQDGFPIEKECFSGFCFDTTKNICLLNTKSKPSDKHHECGATEGPDTTCRPDHNCQPIPDDPVGTCPTPPSSPCDWSFYLPHRDNCKYFYQCVRRKPVQMCCPEGTCFDPALNVCV